MCAKMEESSKNWDLPTYTCECTNGYSGVNCETGESICMHAYVYVIWFYNICILRNVAIYLRSCVIHLNIKRHLHASHIANTVCLSL